VKTLSDYSLKRKIIDIIDKMPKGFKKISRVKPPRLSIRHVNFPLLLGSIILITLFVMAQYPKLVTLKDPYNRELSRVYYTMEDGKRVQRFQVAPFPPNPNNPFGTDEIGRDNLSRIAHGASITLYAALMIVLIRFLISIPMGIWAGLGGKLPRFLIKNFHTVFSAVPPLIACFFVLNIRVISKLELEQSIIAFAVIFTLTGWGKIAHMIQEKTKEIYNQDFVEGKVTIGKSNPAIAVQNILPHLIPSLISKIILEIGMILFLMAQLSVHYIFSGPRLMYSDDVKGTWLMGQEPEWASMLSRAVANYNQGYWWAGIFPAVAFAYSIMGFNLFGEGLRIEFEKRSSKIVTWIRKIPLFFSPKIYYHQLKKYKQYSKPLIVKSAVYISIFALIIMPPPKSPYPFVLKNALAHMEELSSDRYEGRVVGTPGGYAAGDYIVETLKSYGVEPFFEDGYFQEFDIENYLSQNYSPTNDMYRSMLIRRIKNATLLSHTEVFTIL